MKRICLSLLSLGCCLVGLANAAEDAAPVEVRVDAGKGRIPISTGLYGKNHYALNNNPMPDPQFVRDVGLRLVRDSCGNNCTKYNWKTDYSSHPDWYSNVYKQGLQERAVKFQRDYGDLQALYGLPVLGWVAKASGEKQNYNPTGKAPPARDNLCCDGKTDLYLERSTPKDAVDMLDHWFKPGGLGLKPASFRYFHLDNEPECWASTHHDITPKTITAEECVEKYVAVAKELKRRYPNVRILAPGFSAEWFWWNWSDNKPVHGMPWMQYFVKRMAEESRAVGKPLIDVVDFHTYVSGNASDADLLQEHRIFYDANYQFPRANGCKIYPNGQWNEKQRVELVFARMEKWLDEYFGPGHKIGMAITEAGPGKHPPMVEALWYASMLGTFADHGIEVFTPWEWYEPWWEVMHLFSRYARSTRVEALSSDEPMVSAYASLGERGDGMTVIFVNRAPAATRSAKVTLSGFTPKGQAQALALANLPQGRTFHSHADNALGKASVAVNGQVFSVRLPPYSIVAVVLDGQATAGPK